MISALSERWFMRQQGKKVSPSRKGEVPIENHNSPQEHVVSEVYPREEYLELRKAYVEGEQESYQDFDKAMAVLAGGALGLSITFVKELAPHPQYTLILFVSWMLFTAALLATLISFIASQHAFRQELQNLDNVQCGKLTPEQIKNRWSDATGYLNWVSITSFIAGVILFATFSYMNLP